MLNTGFVAARLPLHGRLGLLRPGQAERQPAGLRRPARSARPALQRPGKLLLRLSAGGAQGTLVRATAPVPIADLFPPKSATYITKESEADGLALLGEINREHSRHGKATRGSKRASPRTSWPPRCNSASPEVLDLSNETAATRKLYGLDEKDTDDFGRNCLIARRLLERGVRFVQVWSGRTVPQATGTTTPTSTELPFIAERTDNRVAGAAQGPEGPRPAGGHAGDLDDRVRPDAVHPGQHRPRPQRRHLRHLAGRRRHQGRHQPTARATSGPGRPRRTRRPATTSTPRSCTCWASTTRS